MKRTITATLRDKRGGLVEAIGLLTIVMTLVLGAGVIMGNYAILSVKAGQMAAQTQEISNRAEAYASELNADLIDPHMPTTDRQCTEVTKTCTTILQVTPIDDGASLQLRIQADMIDNFGTSMMRDVTLISNEVTHVTEVDADGSLVWALSDEGLRYRTWSVAEGSPREVPEEDLTGPTAQVHWVHVDDRAGVDSTGALWVWGPNDAGQAGNGSSTDFLAAEKLDVDGVTFRTVTTESDYAYAIDAQGGLWVWGGNSSGQLGLGHRNWVSTPTKVPNLRVMSVAIGKNNAFAITSDGRLVTTGAAQAELTTSATTTWTVVPGSKYKAIAASMSGTFAAIDSSGRLTVYGDDYGFTPSSTAFSTVSLGGTAGYAIDTTGALYTFGRGPNGELGQRGTTLLKQPTRINSQERFVAVDGSSSSALAIDVRGRLYYTGLAWGARYSDDAASLPRADEFRPLMTGIRFQQVAMNSLAPDTALLDADGNLYGMSTAEMGLWPVTYRGDMKQPIRMPLPEGFSSYTWE